MTIYHAYINDTYPTVTAIRGGSSSRPTRRGFSPWRWREYESSKWQPPQQYSPLAARSWHGRPVTLKFYFGFESSAQVCVEHSHGNAMRRHGCCDHG